MKFEDIKGFEVYIYVHTETNKKKEKFGTKFELTDILFLNFDKKRIMGLSKIELESSLEELFDVIKKHKG